MMRSIFPAALSGIRQAFADAAAQAQKLSSAFIKDEGDPVAPILALKQDQRQVEASAKVIKAGEKMDDEILDILA